MEKLYCKYFLYGWTSVFIATDARNVHHFGAYRPIRTDTSRDQRMRRMDIRNFSRILEEEFTPKKPLNFLPTLDFGKFHYDERKRRVLLESSSWCCSIIHFSWSSFSKFSMQNLSISKIRPLSYKCSTLAVAWIRVDLIYLVYVDSYSTFFSWHYLWITLYFNVIWKTKSRLV